MAPIALALALALFLQAQPATTDPGALLGAPPVAKTANATAPAADEPPPAEDRFPAGAPHDDYQFVAWCYGNLRAYLDLHDQVMPEVTRIESAFRPPNRKLADDLKVYADMQKAGQVQLKQFQAALTAAEKASLRPINTVGAAAVSKGADVWRVTPDITPARLAQAWMSWDLPARCEVTAKTLQTKATLMGGAFKVNEQPDPPPAAEQPAAPPETPTPPTPNPQ